MGWSLKKKRKIINVGKDVEKLEALYSASENVKWCSHCGIEFWWLLNKLNIELPYDPAIPLLSIYPKELKTDVQTKPCTQVFTEALFTIARIGNNPNVHQ